jgi:MFS family permease
LGSAVAPIALAFAVLDLTGSVTDLSIVVAAQSVAILVFALAGGVIADRFPRHAVIVIAGILAAATQATAAATVLTGTATIPLLVILAALSGVFSAVAVPATAALVPQTVPSLIRQQANGINRLGFNGAMITGAAAGGALVASVGPGWGLAVNASTFAIAAACFARVRVEGVRDADAPRSRFLAEMREGWTEFVSHTWLWVVSLGFMILNAAFYGAITVLGPTVADQTIGRSAWGLVLAAQTAGMALGTLIAMQLRVRRFLLLAAACMASEALVVLSLALAPQLAILLAAMLVAGVAIGQFGVAFETTIQAHIPAKRLARVYSYVMLTLLLALPLGQVGAGPAALTIGTELTLLCAAGIIALAVGGVIASKSVRQLEHHLGGQPTGPAHAVTDS